MVYSRRTLGALSAALLMGTAGSAFAQQNDPQTLDGQMQQMHPMQQAQPMEQPSALPPSVPPDAVREWPGAPSMATGPETGAGSEYDGINSEGGGAIPTLPLQAQTMGGITFITGGVGDEEVSQLKASVHNYNFHLLLSSEHGAFISDVNVNIADAGGANLLTVQGVGQYFYALLAPGKYTVELSEDGQTRKFRVNIKDGTNIKKTVEFKEPGGIITPHQPTATVE